MHHRNQMILAGLGLALTVAETSRGQGVLVYDNRVTTVNNGRVNDPDFPAYLRHADNFTLSTAAVVNHVAWLGAYKSATPPANENNFVIQFFHFRDGMPGVAPFASYSAGPVDRQLTSQHLTHGYEVFSYSVNIPDAPLGVGDYLISIVNDSINDSQWMWADADSTPGESYLMAYENTPWDRYSGNGVAEFAFSLYAIPEPSPAILLLAGGLAMSALKLGRHGDGPSWLQSVRHRPEPAPKREGAVTHSPPLESWSEASNR